MGKKHKRHKSERRDYKGPCRALLLSPARRFASKRRGHLHAFGDLKRRAEGRTSAQWTRLSRKNSFAGLCEAAERTDKPLRLVLKVVGAAVASLTTSSPAQPTSVTASTTAATTATASSTTTATSANTTDTTATTHEPPVHPSNVSTCTDTPATTTAATTVITVAKPRPSPSHGPSDDPLPDPDAEPDQNADSDRHRERRKKKKKKSEKERERRPGDEERRRRKVEKKKRREKEQSGSDADEEFSPPKKVEVKAPPVAERPLRACRNKDQGQELTPLQLLLEHLLQQLQRRDPHGFFALPVTDMIAPGYSMIIKHPMDFSSMKDKIERNAYQSLTEFKGDFKLMCDNAMTYNRPETVYYKAARKLLHTGFKMMCKEKLLLLKRSMVFMHSMDRSQEAAIYGEGGSGCSSSPLMSCGGAGGGGTSGGASSEHGSLSPGERSEGGRRARKSGRDTLSFPAVAYTPESSACSLTDSTGEDDVTALAEHAADEARERLQHGRPRSKIGYLRRDCNGATSLAVVNPSDPDTEEEEVHLVNMGVLIGKIHSGIPVPPGFRDDRRGKLRPVTYLNYGPYGGQPPLPPPPPPPPYEGPLASLLDGMAPASSSQLLYSTYGDDAAVQYALSLQEFAKGCGEYAARVVDDLLDALTSGDHSRTLRLLHEKQQQREKAEEVIVATLAEETQIKADPSVRNVCQPSAVDFASFELSLLEPFGKEKAERNQKARPAAAILQEPQISGPSQGGDDLVAGLSSVVAASDAAPKAMMMVTMSAAGAGTQSCPEEAPPPSLAPPPPPPPPPPLSPSLGSPAQLSAAEVEDDDIDRELREFLQSPGSDGAAS